MGYFMCLLTTDQVCGCHVDTKICWYLWKLERVHLVSSKTVLSPSLSYLLYKQFIGTVYDDSYVAVYLTEKIACVDVVFLSFYHFFVMCVKGCLCSARTWTGELVSCLYQCLGLTFYFFIGFRCNVCDTGQKIKTTQL